MKRGGWGQPATIGRDGPHPWNTSGGNVGSSRVHGFGFVMETAMRLVCTAGVWQIKTAEIALCGTGPFPGASCFSCTKE